MVDLADNLLHIRHRPSLSSQKGDEHLFYRITPSVRGKDTASRLVSGLALTRENVMKQLTIVVKPFRAEAVLRALADLGVTACVVQEAKGYSRQKGYLDRYASSEYAMAFLPKVEISVWVKDDGAAASIADCIARTARTGRMGDGKIFELDVAWPEPIEF
jgi:nitrogen regulatory protein PII